MNTIKSNKENIAYCGLYCGSCRSFLKNKCPGCLKNEKATWCTIRKCCISNKIRTCAECKENNIENCKDYNNIFSKVIQFISRTDRKKCIEMINKKDAKHFADHMSKNKLVSIKK